MHDALIINSTSEVLQFGLKYTKQFLALSCGRGSLRLHRCCWCSRRRRLACHRNVASPDIRHPGKCCPCTAAVPRNVRDPCIPPDIIVLKSFGPNGVFLVNSKKQEHPKRSKNRQLRFFCIKLVYDLNLFQYYLKTKRRRIRFFSIG